MRVITRMNIGGPARHVAILTDRCRPDFETSLLAGATGAREGSLANEAAERGIEVVAVPRLRRSLSPWDDLLAFVWLFRHFRHERPAIVATHMAKAGTIGRLAAAAAGVPVIVHTFHGHVLDGYFSRFATSFFLLIERLLSKLTTRFIAISPEIAADLDRLGIGRGKITIVRLGLDLDHVTNGTAGRLRGDLGIPKESALVGIVGRLVPIKAADLFLESAARIAKLDPEVHFVVVGDGELWQPLHDQVESLGLESRVHFTGWRSDLANVYRDLDLVVCCSKNEGTPVALIEASAASKPVIGTEVGGIPDIISPGVNGLLVPSGDAERLSAAILQLLRDPKRREEMGAAGRRLVMERHGSQRMVDELKAVYQDLLRHTTLGLEAA